MQNSGHMPWPADQSNAQGNPQQFQLRPSQPDVSVLPASGMAAPVPGMAHPQFPAAGLTNAVQMLGSSAAFANPLSNPFSSGGVSSTLQQSQLQVNPPDVQMLLANAMSVPLATILFQSMMGGSPPAVQPSQTPNAGLMQLMQQMFQAGAASSAVQPPQLAPTAVPPNPAGVPPVLQPAPDPSPSSAAASQIHLPQMEPSVAKEMVVQLLDQLRHAGQLPNDDDFRRLITPDTVPKVEDVKVKMESMDNKPKQPTDVGVAEQPGTATEGHAAPGPQVYLDIALDTNSVCSLASHVDEEDDYAASDGLDGYRRTTRTATRSKSRSSVAKKRSQPKAKHGTRQESSRQASRSSERSTSASASASSQSVSRERSSPRRSTSSDAKLVEKPSDRSTCRSQQSVSRESSPERCVSADEKVQQCFVKLDRVDAVAAMNTGQKKDDEEADIATTVPALPPPAPLSRIAKLRNYCIPKDILTNKPAPSAAAGSAEQLAEQKSAVTICMKTVDQRPVLSATATKNIFSIFSQRTSNQSSPPLEEPEPPIEPRPSNPLPATVGVPLQRSVNSSRNQSLRSMYMGFDRQHMEWLSLVSCMFASSNKNFCQCSFCPAVGELPRDVAQHIGREHQDCLFALNKITPVAGPLMYIDCRHCNFVTVEETLLWIHFDAHHAVPGILDWTDTPTEQHMSGPDTPAKFIDIDDPMGNVTAFVCFDCSAVNADADTSASSMLMARHVIRAHPSSPNYNGCFVKLMMLTRKESDPNSIKGLPTYREAISDRVHARGRREIFICMFCRFSSFSTYLALSHSLLVHQSRSLLYVCKQTDCQYQCLRAVDMSQHIRVEHATNENLMPLVSSATLVERTIAGDGHVECHVLVGRNSGLTYVQPPPPLPPAAAKRSKPNSASSKKPARKRVKVSSESSENEEEENEDETVAQRRTTRGTPLAKSGSRSTPRLEPAEEQTVETEPERQSTPDLTQSIPSQILELQSTAVSSSNEHSTTGVLDTRPTVVNPVAEEETTPMDDQEIVEPAKETETSETAVAEAVSDHVPITDGCSSTVNEGEAPVGIATPGIENRDKQAATDLVDTAIANTGKTEQESMDVCDDIAADQVNNAAPLIDDIRDLDSASI